MQPNWKCVLHTNRHTSLVAWRPTFGFPNRINCCCCSSVPKITDYFKVGSHTCCIYYKAKQQLSIDLRLYCLLWIFVVLPYKFHEIPHPFGIFWLDLPLFVRILFSEAICGYTPDHLTVFIPFFKSVFCFLESSFPAPHPKSVDITTLFYVVIVIDDFSLAISILHMYITHGLGIID